MGWKYCTVCLIFTLLSVKGDETLAHNEANSRFCLLIKYCQPLTQWALFFKMNCTHTQAIGLQALSESLSVCVCVSAEVQVPG